MDMLSKACLGGKTLIVKLSESWRIILNGCFSAVKHKKIRILFGGNIALHTK